MHSSDCNRNICDWSKYLWRSVDIFTMQRFKEMLDQLHPPPLHLATFSNWQKLHIVCLKNKQPLFFVISKISYLVIKMKRTQRRCQPLCQHTLIPPLWHRTCSPLCLSHFLNFIYIRGDFFAEHAALVQHRSASPSQGSTHPHLLHSTATIQAHRGARWGNESL